jgi:hypothetical protein
MSYLNQELLTFQLDKAIKKLVKLVVKQMQSDGAL